MEDKKNILLISRDENCATEVMEFLLKSKCIFGIYESSRPNEAATAADYAYKGGPPTVIEGIGSDNLIVYCVFKSFNTIQSHMSHDKHSFYSYNAVLVFLEDDNADNYNLILNYIKSQSYLNYRAQENEGDRKKSHNLTIIGNLSQCMLQSITKLLKCESSSWNWNGMFACNWSTHRRISNYLWIHINKRNYKLILLSYNSEIMLRSITNMFAFFRQFLNVMYHNINCIEDRTEAVELCILTRYGDTYRQQTIIAKDLLNQFNILTMSDFAKFLKEEITQLARHLSLLAILCGEIVKIEIVDLLPHFIKKEEFILGYQEEKKMFTRNGEISAFAIYSLDAMSEMKYTGKYIKDVLGIEVLNSLKSCLENFPNFRNTRTDSLSVLTTEKNDSLGNKGREKQESQSENRTQDILVEDRIDNIQLLKSLQNTLQEFTDELKKVRELQEYNTEVVTKEIKIIKEKLKNNCSCHHLNQKLDEDLSRTKE